MGTRARIRGDGARRRTARRCGSSGHRRRRRLRVGDRPTWALVTDMLADPYARAKSFGVHSVLEMPFPAAVKTGTSSDFRDTWTIGFSRDYTVGAWVGNFDGSPMQWRLGRHRRRTAMEPYHVASARARRTRPFAPPAGYVARRSAQRPGTRRCATAGPSCSNG